MKKLAALLLMFGCVSVHAAVIEYAGFYFDENAFADDATLIGSGNFLYGNNVNNIDDALTGFTPETGIFNLSGYTIQLDFTDLMATNNSGTDIILFDSHSNDPWAVAVHVQGESEFSAFVELDISNKTDRYYSEDEVLPIYDGIESPYARALLIDLDAFGLSEGTIVDSIQFYALPNAKPLIEGDPYMAAVYDASVVPIPAAVWLFASGLLGLIGIARRKVNA